MRKVVNSVSHFLYAVLPDLKYNKFHHLSSKAQIMQHSIEFFLSVLSKIYLWKLMQNGWDNYIIEG